MDLKKTLVIESKSVRMRVEMQGGFFDFGFGDKFRVHSHGDFEFHMAVNGDCVFLTETGKNTVKKGDILLVRPYAIHSCIEGTDRMVKMSFCFSFEKKSETGNNTFSHLERAFSSFEGVMMICGKKYEQLVRDILFEVHSDDCFSEERLRSYFFLLITGLARDIAPKKETIKEKEKIAQGGKLYRIMIEEYINLNYNKKISLSHLAEILHLCEKQVSRIIKAEFGMSFSDFVSKIRCGAAEYLLKNTSASVAEIAEKVGYGSYNGFYNMFVANVGIAPTEYREEKSKKPLTNKN